MIRPVVAALCASVMLAGCQPAGQPARPEVEVVDAWASLPAVADRPGAAYFTLRNNGPDAWLTGVQSPRAQRIELHDNQMHDGMMHMMPLIEVPLPRGGSVEFQPGGRHAMLFGVDPQLKPGGTLSLTFSLRDGRTARAQAQVVAPGEPSPYAH